MRPADRAWLGIAAGVTAYEVAACRAGWELLSEAVDRYRTNRPVIAAGTVIYLAAHLVRVWPRRLDPLTRLASRLSR